MAELNAKARSSTPKQRQRLHQLKRRLRWTDDELHEAIGVKSTTLLSAAQASEYIRRLGGGDLPYPPGQKPSPYAGKRKTTDAVRMISPDHVEHIERLLGECFDDQAAGLAWLEKDFKVKHPRDLLTAKRAGQVIRVLKDMIKRRRAGGATTDPSDAEGRETGSVAAG